MISMTRRRRHVEDDQPQPEQEPVEAPVQAQWTAGVSLATKAASALLWAGLIAGPVALFLVVLSAGGSAPPPAPAAAVVDDAGERAAVSEFAQRFVVAWLTTPRGQEDALAGMVSIDQVTLPTVPWTVANPATAAISRQPDQPGPAGSVWSVTVAADVAADARQLPVRRFFTVPVQRSPGAVVALAQPAPVPAPAGAAAADLAASNDVDTRTPLYLTVQQFLAALLSGQGDVSRYLTPTTVLPAITPPPYTSVTVTDVLSDLDLGEAPPVPDDGDRVRVVATAIAQVSDQQRISVSYPLTLIARSGRWEVASIDPAPAVKPKPAAAPSPPASPQPAATPTTPSTLSPAATPASPATATP